jgi:hypothetical protein
VLTCAEYLVGFDQFKSEILEETYKSEPFTPLSKEKTKNFKQKKTDQKN